MPNNKRQDIKRKLDQAVNKIKGAQEDIIKVAPQYEKIHPDLFQAFCQYVSGLELMKNEIARMRDRI